MTTEQIRFRVKSLSDQMAKLPGDEATTTMLVLDLLKNTLNNLEALEKKHDTHSHHEMGTGAVSEPIYPK